MEDSAISVSTSPIPANAAARWPQRFRIPIALVTLVLWLLVTSLNGFQPTHSGNFVQALTDRPEWGILAAGVLLVVVVAACRWRDLGLNRLVSIRGLLPLLWLPGLYLLFFFLGDIGVAVAFGPPPLSVIFFLLLNTLLAGFSEEMMFRGVLFGALRSRLRPLWAILITTLLFGAAHLLNAAVIGGWQVAAAQATAAGMSGLLFIAIRVRTGSLIPAILYHAAWDFGSLVAVSRLLAVEGIGGAAGGGGLGGAAEAGQSPLLLAVPVILLLPNFLYALYLLRPRRPRETA